MTSKRESASRAAVAAARAQDPEAQLRAASNEGLLKAYASLTHQIHVAERREGVGGPALHLEREARALRLRTQRDRVEAEILRRMES